MIRKNNTAKTSQNPLYIIIILLAVILSFFIGASLSFYTSGPIKSSQTIFTQKTVFKEKPVYISNSKEIAVRKMDIPAVSSEGQGISGTITVIVKKGTGQILTDVSNILINEDTEHSARTAAYYAFNYTKKDPHNYDVIYHIDINAPAIEGGSAGVAMTVLTIAALQDFKINQSVSTTGTINHDGTIGPAEGIEEKAEAMQRDNKTLFLVPYTESEKIIHEKEKYCRNYGNNRFCSEEVVSDKINIGGKVGIAVKEVKTIKDALKYLIISQ